MPFFSKTILECFNTTHPETKLHRMFRAAHMKKMRKKGKWIFEYEKSHFSLSNMKIMPSEQLYERDAFDF